MCEISDKIRKSRKDIKDTSLDAYTTTLRKIKKDLDSNSEYDCMDIFEDFSKIKEYLNKYALTTKKNKITAIIVWLKSQDTDDKKLIQRYLNYLDELNDKYNEYLNSNEKSDTQKKNWVDYNELVKFSDKLTKKVKIEGIRTKDKIDKTEFKLLQDLVILRTYLEYPLRNDFADMKVITKKEEESMPDDKNYLVLDGSKMSFNINEYKNRERLGKRVYKIPKSLSILYKIWLKHNNSGWFLVQLSNRQTPLSPNNLTKYMNKMFKKEYGKNISTSMIRHITISEMNKDKPTIEEVKKENEEVENRFLHSKKMNDQYRKT